MRSIRKGRLPGSEAIVAESFTELGLIQGKVNPIEVQRNFNALFHRAWLKTLTVLERYEKNVYGENLAEELMKVRAADFDAAEKENAQYGFRTAVRQLFRSWYPYLVESFLSISQSRKQRGGKDFELQFAHLLTLMTLPYERIDRKYRVDFMIPSSAAFARNRTTAMIASAKRTLRERWREVVEELHNTRAPNVFLVTADSDISVGHIKEICGKYNIHLVVWDEVKQSRFNEEPLVLSYSQWANDRIPALRQFWST